ncbi:MAG: hypothetical protein HY076_05650, partial [Candidatus Eisenbacteria bacterium]|nr:hypothetical protein [Candidatus Eisenbacteria bacterium]
GAGAWSPRGARLALIGPEDRVYVVDAEHAERGPRRVCAPAGPVRWVSWSPDGTWLSLTAGPDSDQVALAMPAEGGAADTLLRHAAIRASAWGRDGRIYCWIGAHRRALDPPARWTGAGGASAPPAIEVTDSLEVRLRSWNPGPGEELLLTGVTVTIRIDRDHPVTVRPMDVLPDGSRALIGLARDSTARWLLVDGDGRTRLDLRHAGLAFQPTGIGGGGAWVAGFTGRWLGGAWRDARIVIADGAGRWTAPIAGAASGLGPQCARAGGFIAFLEPISGATRVGRIVAGAAP